MSTWTLKPEIKVYGLTCSTCGTFYCVENSFDDERRRDSKTFYCPNGHTQSYNDGIEARLREELDIVYADANVTEGLLATAKRSLSRARSKIKKLEAAR